MRSYWKSRPGGCHEGKKLADRCEYLDESSSHISLRHGYVGYDRLWDASLSTLRANQIPITNAAKDAGQITTDYLAGPSTFTFLATVGNAQATRYKYNIFFNKQGANRTALDVKTVLEASGSVSRSMNLPFRDLSAENPRLVSQLDSWLYEQIERSLQP